MTQEELANKAGLSIRAIGDLERNRTARPHRRSLELLAEALELPADVRARLIEAVNWAPSPEATDVTGLAAVPGPFAPAPRPAPGAVPAELPTDIADFTGRTELVVELRELLSGQARTGIRSAVPVVVVAGSGGLGKTALAVHTAHQVARKFPDGQLYVNLRGAAQNVAVSAVLARFLRVLGVDAARIPADVEERAALYRTMLADRRVLIVLDDARDAEQVQPLLPGNPACAVVVTARGQLPEIVGAKVVELDVLPPEDALNLFARIVGEKRAIAEPAATEDVLVACAGLPLAIRIAGARLAARGSWTVRSLAGRLADERRRLDELRAGNLAVRVSFEVSFAGLPGPVSPGGPAPARAFRLLGLWTGPSISLPAAAALLGETEYATADALDVLVDARLLESPVPDRYRFHDLLRVYAADRARIQETEQDRMAAITRVLAWYLHTAEAAAKIIFPQHVRVPLGAAPAGPAPAHHASLHEALSWCEAERTALAAATALAARSGLHEFAWKLPAAAMSFYNRRSHMDDWITTHQAGLASARAIGDRGAEAWMLNNLGMAYGTQRREESVACFEQALALSRETGDTAREARVANNLANTLLNLGRFERAEEAAISALDLDRRIGDRFAEGAALVIIGCSCRELGRFGEAVDYLQRSLAISAELDDHPSTADALSDLGVTYLGLGQVADAITCLRQSLEILRDIGDLYYLAQTLHRLGQAQAQAGEPGQGREQFREALTLYESLGETALAADVRVALTGLTGLTGSVTPRAADK